MEKARECFEGLRHAELFTRAQLLALALGQAISLLITGTGVSSQFLADKKHFNAPTFQSFLNYLLLAAVYGIILWRRGNFLENLKLRWKYYLPLALIDVEANYIVVKAYQYTTITSVMLIDCFTIPCAVALTYFFLKTRYNWRHGIGVGLCLVGLVVLVYSDVKSNDSGKNPILGDILCFIGAVLYSCSNVAQEAFVKKFDRVEYLGFVGLFAVFINGLQFVILERHEVASASADLGTILLIAAFVACLFTMYSLTPIALVYGGSALFNINLLTSDAYAVLAALFLFNNKLSNLFFFSLALTVCGLMVYNIKNAPITVEEYESLERASDTKSDLRAEEPTSLANDKTMVGLDKAENDL